MKKKDFSPEIQKLIDENPAAVIVGMVLMGAMLMQPTKQGPDVPGLKGRRNSAWRGKGSYGKAPFGKQMGHKR